LAERLVGGSGENMTEIGIIVLGASIGFGLYSFFSLLGYGIRNLIKILD